MIKILSITLHDSHNCGSSLQAFALNRFLCNAGFDASIIDYTPDYERNEGNVLRNLARKIIYFRAYRSRKSKFDRFAKKYYKLTDKKYKTLSCLMKKPPNADIYFAGSDQIWNPYFPCGRDGAFYLEFVKNKPKLSYAASLGNDNMTQEQLLFIKDKIQGFDYISVREKCACEQLESVGIKNTKWVCDPTLLLDRSVYYDIAAKPEINGKYIAVYLVERSDLLDQYLKFLKKEYGFLVVGVGGYIQKFECDIHIKDVGPCEFLGLLRDAEFVVATSFHATVFSILFNKAFAIIPPRVNPARIEQFLSFLELENRIIKQENEFARTIKEIQYQAINTRINEMRESSSEKLMKAIRNLGSR